MLTNTVFHDKPHEAETDGQRQPHLMIGWIETVWVFLLKLNVTDGHPYRGIPLLYVAVAANRVGKGFLVVPERLIGYCFGKMNH